MWFSINSLAIGLDDSSINLIDLRTLGRVGKYKEKNGVDGISCLQFSKSGRILFSCSSAQPRVMAWDTICETSAGVIGLGNLQDGVNSISLSRSGTTLVSAGREGTLAVWD